MKKIFKKIKLRDLVLIITGLIIEGSIGITAITYVLQANEIEYRNNKSVQEAIEELYTMAENGSGSAQVLPLGTVGVNGRLITIPYTGNYDNVRCIYGTDETYGNEGTLSNGTCTFTGTTTNQKLYYKLIASKITDGNSGTIYETSGSVTTGNTFPLSTVNVGDYIYETNKYKLLYNI